MPARIEASLRSSSLTRGSAHSLEAAYCIARGTVSTMKEGTHAAVYVAVGICCAYYCACPTQPKPGGRPDCKGTSRCRVVRGHDCS
jgi:hypothetical protein